MKEWGHGLIGQTLKPLIQQKDGKELMKWEIVYFSPECPKMQQRFR